MSVTCVMFVALVYVLNTIYKIKPFCISLVYSLASLLSLSLSFHSVISSIYARVMYVQKGTLREKEKLKKKKKKKKKKRFTLLIARRCILYVPYTPHCKSNLHNFTLIVPYLTYLLTYLFNLCITIYFTRFIYLMHLNLCFCK